MNANTHATPTHATPTHANPHVGSDSLEKHIDQSPGQPHEHGEQESASPVQDSNLARQEKTGRFTNPPPREPGDRELLDPEENGDTAGRSMGKPRGKSGDKSVGKSDSTGPGNRA